MTDEPTAVSKEARCQVPPEGWWCSREPGHDGPCAARIDPATDKAGGLWYGRWWGAMERVEALERELAHLRTPAATGWASPALGRAYHEVEQLREQLAQHPESGIDETLRAALSAIEAADCEPEGIAT